MTTTPVRFDVSAVSTASPYALVIFKVAGREPMSGKSPIRFGRGVRPESVAFWIGETFVWLAGPLRDHPDVVRQALVPHERWIVETLDLAQHDEAQVRRVTLTLNLPNELATAVIAGPP